MPLTTSSVLCAHTNMRTHAARRLPAGRRGRGWGELGWGGWEVIGTGHGMVGGLRVVVSAKVG